MCDGKGRKHSFMEETRLALFLLFHEINITIDINSIFGRLFKV